MLIIYIINFFLKAVKVVTADKDAAIAVITFTVVTADKMAQ